MEGRWLSFAFISLAALYVFTLLGVKSFEVFLRQLEITEGEPVLNNSPALFRQHFGKPLA